MIPELIIRRGATGPVFVAAVILLAVLAAGCTGGADDQATTEATPTEEKPASVLGIDADPTGVPANTATSLGSIETCISVTTGATFDIDVFVDPVPGDRDLGGFNYFFHYDSSMLQIVGVNHDMLLTSQPDAKLAEGGETVMPDSDGTLRVAVADLNLAAAEPGGSRGVLARYQLQAVAAGTSSLSLEGTPTYLTDTSPAGYDPDQVLGATIAVDEPCPESGAAS